MRSVENIVIEEIRRLNRSERIATSYSRNMGRAKGKA
jgi:hypothetical protein